MLDPQKYVWKMLHKQCKCVKLKSLSYIVPIHPTQAIYIYIRYVVQTKQQVEEHLYVE